jgi:hypothetical protein
VLKRYFFSVLSQLIRLEPLEANLEKENLGQSCRF